ncbi:glycerate kinase type-2 family protein [Novacetimonas pomaceti]|uniref:glycerate kinase type-2 family protein n=1 Tax=Novacetimonas pomaceti TaxID=2021998 RepID=UPI001C2D1036|nr:glycerate kinase [Novacetimonas pomaceti]MBV1833644.1 glycerate kinase [Novacetimonas pomaceti]
MSEERAFLTRLFRAAVAAADPEVVLRPFLPSPPAGRTVVVGAGKGVAQLARALERAWDAPLSGIVVTRYGYGVQCERIRVVEASHPVPDAAGLEATRLLFDAVAGLAPDDLVIALVCGGGSALLPAPVEGLDLSDEIALNEVLLASGAPISVMNMIRKQVSRIKGGRLAAAAWPARVVTLVVSDIPGDDPALVASGPTVPDPGTRHDALAAIERYGIAVPPAIMRHLRHAMTDAPRPDDPVFQRNTVQVIASAARSLEAAAEVAAAEGIRAAILSDSMEGESRDVAQVHAAIAREIVLRNRPFPRPVVLLSGGETTVTLRGDGMGGRNSEFALAFALGINGMAGIHALAADTDGIDGSEDNAGAFADASTASRLYQRGMDPAIFLRRNDAWTAFSCLGDLFVTGPTGTNVNDFRVILIS